MSDMAATDYERFAHAALPHYGLDSATVTLLSYSENGPFLVESETGRQVLINTSDPRVRQAYARRIDELRDSVAAALGRNQAEHIPVVTEADYLPALKSYFRSRKRR